VKSHLRQREGVRGPLNRIVKAAKMRREPVFGLSVSKIRGGALFLKLVGRLYKISRVMRALKPAGLVPPRERYSESGGRDALSAVWEQSRKQPPRVHNYMRLKRRRACVGVRWKTLKIVPHGRRFLPLFHRYGWRRRAI
jgi:hypothetical protein